MLPDYRPIFALIDRDAVLSCKADDHKCDDDANSKGVT